jgi:hypothetical protein
MTRLGEFNDPMPGHRIGYSGHGKINRKDVGLTFKPVLDGRFVVSDEVTSCSKANWSNKLTEPDRQRPTETPTENILKMVSVGEAAFVRRLRR